MYTVSVVKLCRVLRHLKEKEFSKEKRSITCQYILFAVALVVNFLGEIVYYEWFQRSMSPNTPREESERRANKLDTFMLVFSASNIVPLLYLVFSQYRVFKANAQMTDEDGFTEYMVSGEAGSAYGFRTVSNISYIDATADQQATVDGSRK